MFDDVKGSRNGHNGHMGRLSSMMKCHFEKGGGSPGQQGEPRVSRPFERRAKRHKNDDENLGLRNRNCINSVLVQWTLKTFNL